MENKIRVNEDHLLFFPLSFFSFSFLTFLGVIVYTGEVKDIYKNEMHFVTLLQIGNAYDAWIFLF